VGPPASCAWTVLHDHLVRAHGHTECAGPPRGVRNRFDVLSIVTAREPRRGRTPRVEAPGSRPAEKTSRLHSATTTARCRPQSRCARDPGP
jgi:hypothetical protein